MKRNFVYILALFASVHVTSFSQCLTLEQCVRQAVSNNLTVRQREIAQRKGRISLSTVKNSRLPNLNGSASQQFSFGRSLTVDNTYSNYNTAQTSVGMGTSVPLFTGMRIPNEVALAKLNLKAVTADLESVKEDLSIQVAQAYLQVLFNKELHEAAKAQTKLAMQQQQRVEAFARVEKATVSQLADAQSLVAQRQLAEVQTANDYQLSLLDLSQLLEMDSPTGLSVADVPEEAADELFEKPEEIFRIACAQKSSIKAAELRIEGAEKSVKIAQSAYYPTLDFNAGIGSGYYHTKGVNANSFGRQLKDNFNKYFGFNLSVPIFNRLNTRNAVRQAKEDKFNDELLLDQTRKQLYKEIQQAYYNAVAAHEKYLTSKVALETSQTAFEYTSKSYESGKSNATQYAEASTNVLKSTSDMLQAKYDCIFRYKILNFFKGEPIH